ncbi:MAG: hypothetical protein V4527_18295 [Pseudomonadota bacterium]
MPSNPHPAPASLDAARLSRLDAEIAALQNKLSLRAAERAEVAARWGYANNYRMRVSPDQMRAVLNAEKRNG